MKLFISEKTSGHLTLYFPYVENKDVFVIYDNKPLQQSLIKDYDFEIIYSNKKLFPQVKQLIKKRKPSLIYISGGKLGFYAGLIAKKLKIDFIMIEPNVLPGLSNYTLAFWAKKIIIYNPATQIFFPPAVVFKPRHRPIKHQVVPSSLLIVGGSNGSSALVNFLDTN